jgi:hypothetical protein
MEEVVIVIAILETFPRRKISIVTNTINHLQAGVANLLIIVMTNMKSRSTCRRREMPLVAQLEIRAETRTTITVAGITRAAIIINTITNRAIMLVEVTKVVMEISNNKKTMEVAITDPQPILPMKTR